MRNLFSGFFIFKYALSRFYSALLRRQFKNAGRSFFVEVPIKNILGAKYISIGENFNSLSGLRLEAIPNYFSQKFSPQLIIKDNVIFNNNCHIGCINKVIIGNNVLLASKVFISDHSHGEINARAIKLPPANRDLYSKGPVIIEENVWIGENVVVLPNVTIGKNAIIGANAVVTQNIPPSSVAAGIPARVIKTISK